MQQQTKASKNTNNGCLFFKPFLTPKTIVINRFFLRFDTFRFWTDIHVPRHGDTSIFEIEYRNRAQQKTCLKRHAKFYIYDKSFLLCVPLIAQLSGNLQHLALPLIFDANTPHQVMPEIQNQYHHQKISSHHH